MKPSPLIILHARARARATLFKSADIATIEEAIEPLIAYAFDSGIVERVGKETAWKIIATEFEGLVEWESLEQQASPANS